VDKERIVSEWDLPIGDVGLPAMWWLKVGFYGPAGEPTALLLSDKRSPLGGLELTGPEVDLLIRMLQKIKEEYFT
jgi:hypothetical protein